MRAPVSETKKGGYRQRLARALDEYEQLTGERLPIEGFNPANAEVNSAYKLFLRRPIKLSLGANEGEMLAFTLGLKPLLREVVDPRHKERRLAHFGERGLCVQALDISAGEDALGGYTVGDKVREALDESLPEYELDWRATVERSRGASTVLIVGHDEERVSAALEIDRRLVDDMSPENEAELVREHGRLLGYPDCCVKAYADAIPVLRNRDVINNSAEASTVFNYLLNNLTLGIFHHVAWYPCSYECAPSLAWARKVDAWVRAERPRDEGSLRWALSMPRLYADDRRQFIFEGYPEAEGRICYKSIYTPYALDRSDKAVMVEWVFFLHEVWPLLQGDRIDYDEFEIHVYKGEQLLESRLAPEGMVALPFRSAIHRG